MNKYSKIFQTSVGVSLLVCAIVVGTLSYILIADLELSLANSNYQYVSKQAIDITINHSENIMAGGHSMALNYRTSNPDIETWPNATITKFISFAYAYMQISGSSAISFSPIIHPENVHRFEAFAYEFFDRDNSFPGFDIESSFGRGVYSYDFSLNNTDKKYHDTTGETSFGSAYEILTPILQAIVPYPLMLNGHSNPIKGRAMDASIDCVKQSLRLFPSQEAEDDLLSAVEQCAMTSDLIGMVIGSNVDANNPPDLADAQAIIFEPILLPVYDNATIDVGNAEVPVVGFVNTIVTFGDLLREALPNYVSGIDFVFETDTTAFTYHYHDGSVDFVGEGDKHDSTYSSYKQSKAMFKSSATPYTITVYPTAEYFEDYESNLPLYMCIGSVLLTLLCSALFVTYDMLMRRQHNETKAILETKRRYVRFISHEVRTPLNIDCSGLLTRLNEVELAIQSMIPRQEYYSKCLDEDNTCGSDEATLREENNLENHQLQKDCVLLFQLLQHTISITRSSINDLQETNDDLISNNTSAVNILNDLINYENVERGDTPLELRQVNIVNKTNRIVESFRGQALSSQIDMKFHINTDSMRILAEDTACLEEGGALAANLLSNYSILGDPMHLTQAIRNLISNSLKFTPDGGSIEVNVEYKPGVNPKLQVQRLLNYLHNQRSTDLSEKVTTTDNTLLSNMISSEEYVGSIVVSICDTGAGLSLAQLNNIFNEGVEFDVADLQSSQGSGLQLFIAKGIIEQHGGRLAATSDGVGCGSVFSIELPLWHIAASKRGLVDDALASAINGETSQHNWKSSHEGNFIHRNMKQLDTLEEVSQEDSSSIADDLESMQHSITGKAALSEYSENGVIEWDSTDQSIRNANESDANSATEWKSKFSLSERMGGMVPLPTPIFIPPDGKIPNSRISNTPKQINLKSESTDSSASGVTVTPSFQHDYEKKGLTPTSLSSTPIASYAANTNGHIAIQVKKITNIGSSNKELVAINGDTPRLTPVGSQMPSSILGKCDVSQYKRSSKNSKTVRNILIVDDSAMNRKMLSKILASSGHMIHQANNGKVAIDIFDAAYLQHNSEPPHTEGNTVSGWSPFDCVLMDFEMPTMNGPTCTKILREKFHYNDPIIGITGNVLPADVEHFLSQGATAVLAKPVKIQELEELW